MENFDIAVIGGGAAGIIAAIEAAGAGARVCILEGAPRIGKSILVSGNGRCNLSNVDVASSHYNTSFVGEIITKWDCDAIREYFARLGAFTAVEDGRVYPYSFGAANFLNVLLCNLIAREVSVVCDCAVQAVNPAGRGYDIVGGGEVLHARKVILACGMGAGGKSGSSALLSSLGLEFEDGIAALTYLATDDFKGLAGVRVRAEAELFADGKLLRRERGEFLFKEGALSGVAAFNISVFCARAMRSGAKDLRLLMDFAPDISEEELEERFAASPLASPLEGLLHKNLAACVSARANRKNKAHVLKRFPVTISGLGKAREAQIMCGGLDVEQWNPSTLQCLRTRGIYAAGEALDVDGECGGFNLHWAWASGITAGRAAAEALRVTN